MHIIYCFITAIKYIMSAKELFKEFYAKLVRVLPLDNVMFIIMLESSNFMTGDVKNEINAKPTRADKAIFFLNTTISPALSAGNDSLFFGLLKVMEDSDIPDVKAVAKEILKKGAAKSAG